MREMSELESVTRKKRIDTRLRSSSLNWKIIHNNDVEDTSFLDAHTVEEYPTETGPADFALFVRGKLLGIIEAKKIAIGAEPGFALKSIKINLQLSTVLTAHLLSILKMRLTLMSICKKRQYHFRKSLKESMITEIGIIIPRYL